MSGIVYLIPVTLGGENFREVIPEDVLAITKKLRFFLAEDLRSARRFLRLIDREFPIDNTRFLPLNEHVSDSELESYLEPVINGNNVGIISEAGLPCIADPGSKIVALAHRRNIIVKPLSGPSSIILSLIASGFNGQNFTFHGYLPVKPEERKNRLKELERNSRKGYAQIFMETPYRNHHMFEAIINCCNPESELCIAADITLPSESILSKRISEWKKIKPDLKDRMVIFILQ